MTMDGNQSIDPYLMSLFQSIGAGKPGRLPMPSFLKDSEVRSKSNVLATSIFDSWNLLKTIVERHEATIRKRWMKKTKENRKKILLTSWPDMASLHRPDIDAFKKHKKKSLKGGFRASYMWPYINLDDLSKPKTLLIFLNARARTQPYSFARADIDACRFGIISQALIPGFLDGYVMMFTGRTDPATYGELIAWEDHPDASHWLHTQRGAHPGEGLLILEIQDKVYRFLAECCKEILQNMTEETLIGLDVGPQPEPPPISSNEMGLMSMASSAAETPYRVPADLNLERLESIIEARLSSAEDHVWALREDPGYFEFVLREYKTHRQETMTDTNGKKHPLFASSTQERVFWDRVITNSIVSALAEVEIWGVLLDKVAYLRRLATKYAGEINTNSDLPEEYAFAFYTLLHHLEHYTHGPIGLLKHGFTASPPMRSYFDREPQDSRTTIMRTVKRTALQEDPTRDTIIWIFMCLFDKQQLHLAGLNTLMDELERIQTDDPRAKDLISPWVADKISDLSIISYCRHQIELYQPWAASFEDEMAARRSDIDQDFSQTKVSFEKYFNADIGHLAVSLGIPDGGKFRFPADKRRTRESTEAMRQAEKNLDKFWYELDMKLAKIYPSSPRIKTLLSQRVLERTPEWVEPTQLKKPGDADAPNAKADSLSRPLSDLQLNSQHDIPSPVSREPTQLAKVKPKTRGTPSSAFSSAPPTASKAQTDSQPTFSIDKRAHKVFKMLFYTPSASSQPGEVAWHDLVHALCSTCFSAEKLYGSVWQFRPQGLKVERGIHFHEPHPRGKIPFVTARQFGRRLSRAYGWHGDMFVCPAQ